MEVSGLYIYLTKENFDSLLYLTNAMQFFLKKTGHQVTSLTESSNVYQYNKDTANLLSNTLSPNDTDTTTRPSLAKISATVVSPSYSLFLGSSITLARVTIHVFDDNKKDYSDYELEVSRLQSYVVAGKGGQVNLGIVFLEYFFTLTWAFTTF